MSTSRMLVKMDMELDSFPAEMINHLFSLFHFNDGKQFRQINKRWRDIFDKIIFNDKQQIFCKLFTEKIDFSVNKSLGSFLDSLKQLSDEKADSIIQSYIEREKISASKQVNRKFRSLCSCNHHPFCVEDDLSEEEKEADLSKCDLFCWSLPFSMLGLFIGVLIFIVTILTTQLKGSNPSFFLMLAFGSMILCTAICSVIVPGASSLSSFTYPKITRDRAESAARDFLAFYHQEKKNITDITIEIPEEKDTELGILLDQGLSSTNLV